MPRIVYVKEDESPQRSQQNPQYCDEYEQEILEHMIKSESLHQPNKDYMKLQDSISEKMRAILIDWIIEVHFQFKLLPETLFITINIVDRYLSETKIKKEQLQLIGVTALLIACKYEEVLTPEIRDLEFITDNSFKKREILDTEHSILSSLQFSLTVITPTILLGRFADKIKKSYGDSQPNETLLLWNTLIFLAKYIIELQLAEYRMLQYTPSLLAAGSLYLSLKMMRALDKKKKQLLPDWPSEMNKLIGRTEKDVRECAKDLCVILQNAEHSSLQAARKKYMLQEYQRVSLINVPDSGPNPKKKEKSHQENNNMIKGYREAR